jgi:hypothetical protein
MFSIFDMLILGACSLLLGLYVLLVWFDREDTK